MEHVRQITGVKAGNTATGNDLNNISLWHSDQWWSVRRWYVVDAGERRDVIDPGKWIEAEGGHTYLVIYCQQDSSRI